ncbi:MAG TPA: SLATT domain-containing protein [Kofleriaceae bacterium]
MGRKEDVRQSTGRKADSNKPEFLAWDQFSDKKPQEALQAIYQHAEDFSERCREWYWQSIRGKRLVSTGARFTAFTLGALGVIAPLAAAAIGQPGAQQSLSLLAVPALAAAGLTQLADRVFGWSSGWLRYMSTVTAMESLTRQFQLDWAGYFVTLGQAQPVQVKPLFDIAQRFEVQIADLQKRETDAWVIEFNTGLSALNDIVKNAHESSQKSAAEIRDALQQLNKASAVDRPERPN